MVWERRSRVKKEEEKNSSSLGRAVLWAAACAGNRMEVSPEGDQERWSNQTREIFAPRGAVWEKTACVRQKVDRTLSLKPALFLFPPALGKGKFPSAPHPPAGDRVSLGC